MLLVGLGQGFRTDHQVAGRDRPARVNGDRLGRRQEIARKLFGQELVVGEILVEGIDDIVAIPPGVTHDGVGVVGGRFGVTHEIEPVSAPTLAVVARLEQPIDNRLISLRRRVGQKGIDFFRSWRQSD